MSAQRKKVREFRLQTMRSAFTLIEMLIVVAIMAILAAATISFITIPPREQVQATTDLEIEQGLGGFFTRLVADAHNATTLTLAREGRALIFDNVRSASFNSSHAIYFLDRKDCLRRALATSADADPTSLTSALLARNVRRLSASPLKETGMWRIEISLATGDDFRPTVNRELELSVGHFRRK